MFVNLPLGGLRIRTSEYLGELVTPSYPHPERLKHYKQRTLKRWRRAHPAYYKPTGKYYIVEGRTLVCHPADLEKLRLAIETRRPGDVIKVERCALQSRWPSLSPSS